MRHAECVIALFRCINMQVFAEQLLLKLVYKMNSDIENCFAMDCVREDFAMIFIKMDENLNEIRKSCQNDDEVKKCIECLIRYQW